jgi:hypothetical protein
MGQFSKGLVAGIDLGDKYSYVHMVDEAGTLVEETRIETTAVLLAGYFQNQG